MINDTLRAISKKYNSSIKDIYKDEDGYWVNLKSGYITRSGYCADHTIHEDTITELMKEIKQIRKE